MNWCLGEDRSHDDRMDLHGVLVPLITPLDHDGEVAIGALHDLAHRVLDDGATGLVALGTTAEPAALTPGERASVLEVLTSVCRSRGVPLLAGANGIDDVRSLGAGITAAMTVVPPYLRPGEAGVEAYFRAVAAASPVPVIVYHVPARTGQELSPAALHRLARIPGVAGIKYSPGRIDTGTMTFLRDLPPGFTVLGGDDALISPLLALGAHGGILAAAHLATASFVDLARAWQDGDTSRARTLTAPLTALAEAAFAEPNPTVVKAVLHATGQIPTPAVRLPLLPAGPEATTAALDRLAAAGR